MCLDWCRSDEAILGESAVAARLQELGGQEFFYSGLKGGDRVIVNDVSDEFKWRGDEKEAAVVHDMP